MTITALAVGLIGWILGRHPAEVVALVGATAVPVPTLAATAALVLRKARSGGPGPHRTPDALFLVRMAADLRAGESLRAAVSGAGAVDRRFATAARLAAAGRPMPEVAAELSARLDAFGPEVGGALRVSAAAGGSAVRALEELAGQVLALDDLRRQRRAAMAPGILQAGMLAGAAVLVLVWNASSGRMAAALASGPLPAALVIAGALAVLVGTAVVAWMVRR